jgi:hypothetical protein
MKPIAFFIPAVFGLFLSTNAFATNHPKSCADLRDLTCKPFWPADACEKLYQYAITHNGVYKYDIYDRQSNAKVERITNCIP